MGRVTPPTLYTTELTGHVLRTAPKPGARIRGVQNPLNQVKQRLLLPRDRSPFQILLRAILGGSAPKKAILAGKKHNSASKSAFSGGAPRRAEFFGGWSEPPDPPAEPGLCPITLYSTTWSSHPPVPTPTYPTYHHHPTTTRSAPAVRSAGLALATRRWERASARTSPDRKTRLQGVARRRSTPQTSPTSQSATTALQRQNADLANQSSRTGMQTSHSHVKSQKHRTPRPPTLPSAPGGHGAPVRQEEEAEEEARARGAARALREPPEELADGAEGEDQPAQACGGHRGLFQRGQTKKLHRGDS